MIEYNSIMKKNVAEHVPRLLGKSIIDYIWMYKGKYTVDGSIKNCNAKFLGISVFPKGGS